MFKIQLANHGFQRVIRLLCKNICEQLHESMSVSQKYRKLDCYHVCALHIEPVSQGQSSLREAAINGHWRMKSFPFHDAKLHHKRSTSTAEVSKNSSWNGNFAERENNFFYEFLASCPDCKPYMLSHISCMHGVQLEEEKVTELMERVETKTNPQDTTEEALALLKHWATISERLGPKVHENQKFSQFVRLVMKWIQRMNSTQLIESMGYIRRLRLGDSIAYCEPRKNRIILSKCFDKTLCNTITTLNLKELLLSADFFFALRGMPFTEFPYAMFERVMPLLPTMTRSELLLLLFHVSVCRKMPEGFVDQIMNHLSKDIANLSLEELGIINLAHYKTRTPIRRAMYFMALSENLKKRVKGYLNPICLSAVLKYQDASLNKSKEKHVPQFFNMLEALPDPVLARVPSLPSETLMHAFNLFYSLDMLSENLFLAVVDRVVSRGVAEWRLKDMARVTQILSNIPLGAEQRMEALANIIAELKKPYRQAEREENPRCLLQVAMALTFSGIYPHWLAQEIFSDLFQRAFQRSEIDYRRDLYHLAQSISIEDGSYQGPFLRRELFPKLSQNKLYGKIARVPGGRAMPEDGMSGRDRILADLVEALRLIYPRHLVRPVFLLSHFHTADIEVMPLRVKRSPGEEAGTKISYFDSLHSAIVLHGSPAYQNIRWSDGQVSPVLRQYHAMRPRHLRKMGVTVAEVPYKDFQMAGDRQAFLQDRIPLAVDA